MADDEHDDVAEDAVPEPGVNGEGGPEGAEHLGGRQGGRCPGGP